LRATAGLWPLTERGVPLKAIIPNMPIQRVDYHSTIAKVGHSAIDRAEWAKRVAAWEKLRASVMASWPTK
jgi:hypothetical protein